MGKAIPNADLIRERGKICQQKMILQTPRTVTEKPAPAPPPIMV